MNIRLFSFTAISTVFSIIFFFVLIWPVYVFAQWPMDVQWSADAGAGVWAQGQASANAESQEDWEDELFEQAFSESKKQDHTIAEWDSPEWVGKAFFVSGLFEDSTFVSISKFLLRVVAVIWIVVFLRSGIQLALTLWDEGKMKKVKDNLIWAVWWIVLALSSVAIVYIINSVTKSSLNI